MGEPDQIVDLRAQARHARARFDLYRAKMYGSRPASMTRMRELERACESAEARLRHAEHEAAARSDASTD